MITATAEIGEEIDWADTPTSEVDTYAIYLKDIKRYPLLSYSEECAIARRARLGDETAKWLLVKHNLRLVIRYAKEYVKRAKCLTLRDLIQEGNIGLMRAVQTYDEQLGWKFGTYATWWIRQHISRAIDDQDDIIDLPVHVHDDLRKMHRHIVTYDDPDNEVAEAANMPVGRVHMLRHLPTVTASLNAPPVALRGDTEAEDLINVIGDERAEIPEESAELSERDQIIYNALERVLDSREIRIMSLRFGIGDDVEHTLEEIGKELGITRERVRQIECKALRKLRTDPQLLRLVSAAAA